MRIVLAFDKFKGTFSARQVCEIVAEGIRDRNPKIEVIQRPMGDGGDGSASILSASLGMDARRVEVPDLLGKPMEATIFWQNARRLAVVESAEVLGVSRALASEENLFRSNSCGLGQLLRKSFDLRPHEIWICIGGTMTVDAGWGIASVFGLNAWDADGKHLTPSLENMDKISSFTIDEIPDYMKRCKVTALCDVRAPAVGDDISLFSFLQQKGATESKVSWIQKQIHNFWTLLNSSVQKAPKLEDPFTGAGGGLCLGLQAVFPNMQVEMGAQIIARATALASSFSGSDIIVCGEGCLDDLTLNGKAVSTVCQLANNGQYRLAGVFGRVEGDEEHLKNKLGLSGVFKVFENKNDIPNSMPQVIKTSKQKLYIIGQKLADSLDA